MKCYIYTLLNDASAHTYTHTYTYTYIHIHTYIHTYIHNRAYIHHRASDVVLTLASNVPLRATGEEHKVT